METGVKNDTLFICVYKKFYQIILNYIQFRIKDEDEARDLAQDVFIKVLEYKDMLREDTVKSFLFTITRNVLIDYMRRFYRKKGMDYWLAQEIQVSRNDTEEKVYMQELQQMEKSILSTFPFQRRIVYMMNAHEGKNITEIADKLHLSRRTVECHLFLGRRSMRQAIKACI
ncbi:sigma-70 family RNA polymerase sigma factor [Phocaeicola plebeius]|uniref:sigma-70 family RNA polymerase sigma factor n=1 Tax=Phocaeicola plebeius TaxID=310297 RepID=UPI0019572069|nr:sigma-70 family RNA polymerase sigma factor [Phocaeicola plebeius]MBM6962647.1 sigma-70 family RNA polymerase sigma factor [Phocaeicola plebeius]